MAVIPLLTLVILNILFFFVRFAIADHNITVDDNNPSIVYTPANASSFTPCAVDANGNFEPNQPGCFITSPQNCTTSAHMITQLGGGAALTFQGSAIYVNVLVNEVSDIYTVTLDGTSTNIDALEQAQPLSCSTLFSKTGLDPSVSHTINVTIKGVSPLMDNLTVGDEVGFILWLDNFIYTAADVTNSTSAAASVTSTTTFSSSSTTTAQGASSTEKTSGASKPRSLPLFSCAILLALVLPASLMALSIR